MDAHNNHGNPYDTIVRVIVQILTIVGAIVVHWLLNRGLEGQELTPVSRAVLKFGLLLVLLIAVLFVAVDFLQFAIAGLRDIIVAFINAIFDCKEAIQHRRWQAHDNQGTETDNSQTSRDTPDLERSVDAPSADPNPTKP